MKIDKQTNKKNSELILCFSGWSASPELFRHMAIPTGHDLWICSDYSDLSFAEDLQAYKEVRLIAWSLGVWVAEFVFADKRKPTSAIAINGTPYPISDRFGIPPPIFEGTLANVSQEGMRRFNRRMCGSRNILEQYQKLPMRPLGELENELQFLHQQIIATENLQPSFSGLWTQAIIATGDKIFPVQNLRDYWQQQCPIREIDAPHLPFFQYNTWEELWR